MTSFTELTLAMPKPSQPDLPPEQIEAVVGVDTASDRWHMYCDNGLYQCVSKLHKDIPAIQKRYTLYHAARTAFANLPYRTMLVIEEPLALKNGKTTRLLSMACGVIEAASYDQGGIYVYYADVSQWKKEVIGNGNADKNMIKMWVTLNMGLTFDEPDYYDAAALSIYGHRLLGR